MTMSRSILGQSNYALGHSERELARLSRQGQAFLPFTRKLFEQAGVGPNMCVLDVGSGAGDVSLLAAEIAGPGGKVVGVDREETAVAWATARARSREVSNVKFLVGDPTAMTFDQQFDVIVGRLVLMYYADPVDAIRKLVKHLRHGGLLVFQEFDMDYVHSRPPAPTFERAATWMKQTFTATGTHINIGRDLYSLFLAARMPRPELRIDALIGGGPDFPAYELLAGVIQSLLPVMERMGIATATEVELATLTERMRDEVVASNGIVVSPALIGAWSRKSDAVW
jgi:SAM-dependent methyltransferase